MFVTLPRIEIVLLFFDSKSEENFAVFEFAAFSVALSGIGLAWNICQVRSVKMQGHFKTDAMPHVEAREGYRFAWES